MQKRFPLRQRLHRIVVDTTVEYVQQEERDPKWTLYVVVAGLEDQTNAPDQMAFGRLDGEEFVPLEEEPSPAAGILYHTERTHVFRGMEKPAFRVEGATAADVLEGYIEGYRERVE